MYRHHILSIPYVIILWILTCGIYGYVWIYQTDVNIKEYTADASINPVLDLLLCIFTCGIYQLYWFYLLGRRAQNCGAIAGVPVNDNSMIYILLSVFGMGIAAAAIAQSDLNRVWELA